MFLVPQCIQNEIESVHIDMRTYIDIDDALMRLAMRSTGAPTKRAAVEAALRLLVETRAQTTFRKLWGKVQWQGDLDRLRRGRIDK